MQRPGVREEGAASGKRAGCLSGCTTVTTKLRRLEPGTPPLWASISPSFQEGTGWSDVPGPMGASCQGRQMQSEVTFLFSLPRGKVRTLVQGG